MRVQEEKSKAAAERQRHAKRCVVPQDWGEERFKGKWEATFHITHNWRKKNSIHDREKSIGEKILEINKT